MPRLARGKRPKCIVSSSESRWPPRAALIGSTSPMMSAIETSGVASFSTNRSSGGSQEVGDRDGRRRELLDEPQLARQPGDRRLVAPLADQLATELGDRLERIVIHLAAGDDWDFFFEQRHQAAPGPA